MFSLLEGKREEKREGGNPCLLVVKSIVLDVIKEDSKGSSVKGNE